ncbi:hypothetical protein AB0B63_27405 [Micromonospora sp. NPDC049081]|uniref:hypothetical protein n=1 Tax=Micromonospora sp. NPDC049081 TaxID=3155150 RepID=UPI0033C4C7E3
MMDNLTIKLSQDQALVLSDWLDSVIGTTPFDAIADGDAAVWSPLYALSGALRTSLAEVFSPDYAERLNAARARLLGSLGEHFVEERRLMQRERSASHGEAGRPSAGDNL